MPGSPASLPSGPRRPRLRRPILLRAASVGLAILLGVLAGLPAGAADPPKLRISDPDWPPYFFAGRSGDPPGFAKEVVGACVDEAGFRAEFVHLPIERMRHYVVSGEIDLVTFSRRADREDSVVYGNEALFVDSYRPVVRAGSGLKIDSLTDFDALRLGHVNGLRYSPEFHDYVQRREEAGTLTTLQSTRAAFQMLEAGRIDVFLGTRTNIEWMLGHEEQGTDVEILDYDVRTGHYFVTVPRASRAITDPAAFLAQVDACLAAMKTDGRYDGILSKYR